MELTIQKASVNDMINAVILLLNLWSSGRQHRQDNR